jgi:hypothetical protein
MAPWYSFAGHFSFDSLSALISASADKPAICLRGFPGFDIDFGDS